MAAITIAEAIVGEAQVTLSSTPNTMQEIVIPGNARMCEVHFTSHPGKVIHNGGTDGAVISSELDWTVEKDSAYYWPIPRSAGAHSIWVASGTGSVVCRIRTYEGA